MLNEVAEWRNRSNGDVWMIRKWGNNFQIAGGREYLYDGYFAPFANSVTLPREALVAFFGEDAVARLEKEGTK